MHQIWLWRLARQAVDLRVEDLKRVTLPPIRGRMERIQVKAPFTVVVDYAHSPDALERVIKALRPLCQGHLWCVFGCGGDRDMTKRRPMGQVSALSDGVVVTNDNPRSEKPAKIAEEIALGGEAAGLRRVPEPTVGGLCVHLDREGAIRSVLKCAGPDDVILIAGKGHETYQEVDGEFFDFDDAEVVRRIDWNGGRG